MIDRLVKEQLRNDYEIAGMLAKYNGSPAVFYQKAPPDTARAWERPNFPRVDYNFDKRYDSERNVSGILTVNVWCTSESKYMPEDIEKRILYLMNGCFYSEPSGSPDDRPADNRPDNRPSAEEQLTTCVMWNRSDAFISSRSVISSEPETFGITLLFDLTEFPPQITTDPDPVQGLNVYAKYYFPGVTVIAGQGNPLPDVWRPTDANPALYWRFIGTTTDNRQTYAVNWYYGEFAAHIIAETVLERNRWIKAIVEKIQVDGEVILPDRSPMLAQRIVIRHSADPVREGQILLTGRYGVLTPPRKDPAQIPLNNAIYPNLNMEVRYDGRRSNQ